MADNYSQATFEPTIRKSLFTQNDLDILSGLNVECNSNVAPGFISLYAEEGGTSGHMELEDGTWKDLTEDDLFEVLQGVIKRSNGEVTWISKESAYTCSKMRAGQFGGSAVFITADDVRFVSTAGWLEERIKEVETGDSMIGAEDDDCPMKPGKAVSCQHCEACHVAIPEDKPMLAIVLEGGLVQSVVTNNPAKFADVTTVIIDYDTDYLEKDDATLGLVIQETGDLANAYIRETGISEAGIDLARVSDFINDNAYGTQQERIAITGGYPCEECPDINSDGDRCVNENKCLAYSVYSNHDNRPTGGA